MSSSPPSRAASNRVQSAQPLPASSGWGLSATMRFPAVARRDYRLIDGFRQPHPQLDGLYESVEEAIDDAVRWLEGIGPCSLDTAIGLEVSTPGGCWRTIRQPDQLLCPLRLHLDEA